MIAQINKMKRFLSLSVLSFICLIGGLILLEQEMELTGVLFSLSFFVVFAYGVITWLLKQFGRLEFTEEWRNKEIWKGLFLIGGLSKIGSIEAFLTIPEAAPVFLLILVLTLFACLRHLHETQMEEQGYSVINKKVIGKLSFFSFLIGGFISIMVLDINENDELLSVVAVTYFSTVFFLTLRWIFNQIRSILNLKNEKAKTELLHLKSQVNPHFFFNMLNNLYGLVGKDKDKARTVILKLSDIMRYGIYDGQREAVSLAEEIEYLKNYIELHKMRYHKTIDIRFTSNIENAEVQIMPLLFIILLENAFKHGVENLIKDPYVHIDIQADEYAIHFKVENNFDGTAQKGPKGIGLENLKRRLELVYENKHELTLNQYEGVYVAELSLYLQPKKRKRIQLLRSKPLNEKAYLVP